MANGWEESAAAWLEEQRDGGDYSRRFVLDAPMLARIRHRGFANALDVGCGEGRFCRMMSDLGIRAVGIDPTPALLDEARRHDPAGDYRIGDAEALDLPDASFDLVVSYLTLIDIDDVGRAIREMARVLRPGGSLLIANLTSFSTANSVVASGWHEGADGRPIYCIDRYLDERAEWVAWRNIRIRNWHRPLGTYMTHLIDAGLILRHFAEPEPTGGDPQKADRYRRVPYLMMMEWERPIR